MRMSNMWKLGAGALALSLLSNGPVFAQDGAEFFDGKTINYIVATDAGGGYDTNGRLVAQYMEEHLPGVTIVVRNMPGAGHLIGANFIAASEPDGLTIGTFNTGLIYSQLIEDPSMQLDLTEMSWVGKFASEPRVIVVSEQSGIESYEELVALEEPIRFATCGPGCASTIEATMLINSLDLPIELIVGYDGSEDQLAMQRGEVQGIVGSRSSLEAFVADGYGTMIAQIGGSQTDVPQLADLVTDEDGQTTIALIAGLGNLSRFTAGPPGIPQDRLEALRAAYEQAVNDPELLERAEALQLPVDPMIGDEVAEAIAAALEQPQETIDFLRENME